MWLFTVNFLIFFTIVAAAADAVCVLFLYIYSLFKWKNSINQWKIKRKEKIHPFCMLRNTHTQTHARSRKKKFKFITIYKYLSYLNLDSNKLKNIYTQTHKIVKHMIQHWWWWLKLISTRIGARASSTSVCVCFLSTRIWINFFIQMDKHAGCYFSIFLI